MAAIVNAQGAPLTGELAATTPGATSSPVVPSMAPVAAGVSPAHPTTQENPTEQPPVVDQAIPPPVPPPLTESLQASLNALSLKKAALQANASDRLKIIQADGSSRLSSMKVRWPCVVILGAAGSIIHH